MPSSPSVTILRIFEQHKEEFLALSETYARASLVEKCTSPDAISAAKALSNRHRLKQSNLLRIMCEHALHAFPVEVVHGLTGKKNAEGPFWRTMQEIRDRGTPLISELEHKPRYFFRKAAQWTEQMPVLEGGKVVFRCRLNEKGLKALEAHETLA